MKQEKYKKPETKLSKKVIATCAGIAGLVSLASCSNDQEYHTNSVATVVEHEYDDPDTSISNVFVGRVLVPTVVTDPEHFNLKIRVCEPTEAAAPEPCDTQLREVSAETYNKYPDGSIIPIDEL